LPSIHILRYATKEALKWLDQAYWLPQMNVLKETRKKIMRLLKTVRDSLPGNSASHINYRLSVESDIRESPLKILLHSLSPNLVSEILIPLLFRTDYLLPKSIAKGYESVEAILACGWGDILCEFAFYWRHFSTLFLEYVIHKLHQHYRTKASDYARASRIQEHDGRNQQDGESRVVFSIHRLKFYIELAKYMIDWRRQHRSSIEDPYMNHLRDYEILELLFQKWNPSARLIALYLTESVPDMKEPVEKFSQIMTINNKKHQMDVSLYNIIYFMAYMNI
jgi:hypothetical protein